MGLLTWPKIAKAELASAVARGGARLATAGGVGELSSVDEDEGEHGGRKGKESGGRLHRFRHFVIPQCRILYGLYRRPSSDDDTTYHLRSTNLSAQNLHLRCPNWNRVPRNRR